VSFCEHVRLSRQSEATATIAKEIDMRRIALIGSTALAVFACALLPSGALAHGHHRGHHHARRARHHGRGHAGLFGASNGSGPQQTPSSGPSTGSPAPIENVGPTPGSPEANAGTIVSFTEGVLTIKVGEGEKATTVSGKVTEETELHCIPAPPATPAAATTPMAHTSDNGGWSDGEQGQQSDGEQGMSHDDDQGSGDDQGDDDRNDEGGEQPPCTTANLTPGTIVHRAQLQLDGSGAVFREIVLVA
jgi:hypothetical protein